MKPVTLKFIGMGGSEVIWATKQGTLERSADLPNKMLLFRGVLAANGRAYRSGHWPDKKPPDGGRYSNPALEDSISWGDLGLA